MSRRHPASPRRLLRDRRLLFTDRGRRGAAQSEDREENRQRRDGKSNQDGFQSQVPETGFERHDRRQIDPLRSPQMTVVDGTLEQ